MPLAISSSIPATKAESRRVATTVSSTFGSAYSVAEINAYIAIRDQLLTEAEELHTRTKLASTALANDFVQAACSWHGRPTRLNVYPKRMPFGNANAVKRCETESRS